MLKFTLLSTVALVLAGSAVAADAPVFPERKVAALVTSSVAPTGAQYRVRSGKSGVRYLACNEQRSFGAGNVELHCLSFSATKGWGKSLRWYPKYQLAGLKGELPADPVVTALR
jgi:hypothetical protein